MKYYPVYLDLRGKKCLVVGGGQIAQRKVEGLLNVKAKVTLISPQLTPHLRDLATKKKLTYLARKYRKGDTKGYFLAYDASADPRVGKLMIGEAANDVLVNIVDRPELCNFIAPALVQRGNLMVAISTSGESPALAKKVRRELERSFGPEYETVLRLLSALRKKLKKTSVSALRRRQILTRLVNSDLLHRVERGEKSNVEKLLSRIVGRGWNLRRLGVRL